jgi:hypothetical protein
MDVIEGFDEESLVMVYDPTDGHIVHEHHFVTSRGGVHPDQEAREALALEHARKSGHEISKVAMLSVKSGDFKHGSRYRVDVAQRQLVEHPAD